VGESDGVSDAAEVFLLIPGIDDTFSLHEYPATVSSIYGTKTGEEFVHENERNISLLGLK
jgi:hypothetical protein